MRTGYLFFLLHSGINILPRDSMIYNLTSYDSSYPSPFLIILYPSTHPSHHITLLLFRLCCFLVSFPFPPSDLLLTLDVLNSPPRLSFLCHLLSFPFISLQLTFSQSYDQMSSVMASQQTTPSDTELLPPTSIDEDCTSKTPSKHKQSWVWVYFRCLNDAYVECQVLDCFGKACKKKLKRDLTGSTKGMSDHLTGFHQMRNPNKKPAIALGALDKYINNPWPKNVSNLVCDPPCKTKKRELNIFVQNSL
ncbi:hypothetical protein O181_002309 [Austropuccinia psidii MF-1]|uniref:BED-type domain-containing protein n=1 Tax=Austropuccinia psidii MF-1 TaxID=1389203 RepID=A0A9Q3GCQ4_9BASI|nr:hypothetical protein [Austropuccinia psidii MF-1]